MEGVYRLVRLGSALKIDLDGCSTARAARGVVFGVSVADGQVGQSVAVGIPDIDPLGEGFLREGPREVELARRLGASEKSDLSLDSPEDFLSAVAS
jgi:hypothetical protein